MTGRSLSKGHKVSAEAVRKEGGFSRDVIATAGDCAAMAEMLGIPKVSAAKAAFSLVIVDGGSIRVTGRVQADLTRICVVSLEEMAENLDCSVEVVFREPVEIDARDADDEDDLLTGDEPEALENGEIDLMRVLYEGIAVEMDPYPRRPEAEFDGLSADAGPDGGETRPDHPFAALEALKNREK
ncbi:MAG: DUF177 domain-containing protein [Rhodospirillaceae bacterium]